MCSQALREERNKKSFIPEKPDQILADHFSSSYPPPKVLNLESNCSEKEEQASDGTFIKEDPDR